jgi:hypothetical protein
MPELKKKIFLIAHLDDECWAYAEKIPLIEWLISGVYEEAKINTIQYAQKCWKPASFIIMCKHNFGIYFIVFFTNELTVRCCVLFAHQNCKTRNDNNFWVLSQDRFEFLMSWNTPFFRYLFYNSRSYKKEFHHFFLNLFFHRKMDTI